MTKHETPKAQQPSIPWSDLLTTQALASLPENPSTAHKAAAMQWLVKQLLLAQEFARWDPKTIGSIVAKQNYREVEVIRAGSPVNCLQALPALFVQARNLWLFGFSSGLRTALQATN